MPWMLRKKETASFDVDCQKGFTPLCPNELPVPKGNRIVKELDENAKRARYRIGSKDAHCEQAKWIDRTGNRTGKRTRYVCAPHYWPAHCIIGTKGFELLDGLPDTLAYDFFVWKGMELDIHPYGACYHDPQETFSTGVIEWLKLKGVRNVICGGLALDYCLGATALQLYKSGFVVYVNLAASPGLNEVSIKKMMLDFKFQGIITINNARSIASF